jgi:predicted nucleotidyltransferase
MVHNRDSRNSVEFEIILKLIREKTHLREIARSINKPHATVMRKLNFLVNNGILDYKQEGKNKAFFIKSNLKAKNYVYSSEIYKLSKIVEKYANLGIIFEEIKKITGGMILLFGSYAKGNAKEDSDIDIYIETENRRVKSKVEEINSKISVKIGKFDLDSLLIKEIIKNHIIIRGLEEYYEKTKFFE